VVAQAFLAAEHGVEVFGVQVAVVHLVAGRAQVAHHLVVQGGVVAGLHRVAIDHEDAHGGVSFFRGRA